MQEIDAPPTCSETTVKQMISGFPESRAACASPCDEQRKGWSTEDNAQRSPRTSVLAARLRQRDKERDTSSCPVRKTDQIVSKLPLTHSLFSTKRLSFLAKKCTCPICAEWLSHCFPFFARKIRRDLDRNEGQAGVVVKAGTSTLSQLEVCTCEFW